MSGAYRVRHEFLTQVYSFERVSHSIAPQYFSLTLHQTNINSVCWNILTKPSAQALVKLAHICIVIEISYSDPGKLDTWPCQPELSWSDKR